MRIGQHMFDDPVAAMGIGVDKPVKQAIAFGIVNLMEQVALFLMTKAVSIGDQEPKIPRVGLINRWIIDLIENPVTDGKPHPATRMVRRSDPFLGTVRPTRFDPRPAKSGERLVLLRYVHAQTAAPKSFSPNSRWKESQKRACAL